MGIRNIYQFCLWALLICVVTATAGAQSFRIQCPTSTPSHATAASAEPTYTGPSFTGQTSTPTGNANGAIKCQQISGGDGYATMADGTQTYLFAFGPLSGLQDMANGLPGTQFAPVFNTAYD